MAGGEADDNRLSCVGFPWENMGRFDGSMKGGDGIDCTLLMGTRKDGMNQLGIDCLHHLFRIGFVLRGNDDVVDMN